MKYKLKIIQLKSLNYKNTIKIIKNKILLCITIQIKFYKIPVIEIKVHIFSFKLLDFM